MPPREALNMYIVMILYISNFFQTIGHFYPFFLIKEIYNIRSLHCSNKLFIKVVLPSYILDSTTITAIFQQPQSPRPTLPSPVHPPTTNPFFPIQISFNSPPPTQPPPIISTTGLLPDSFLLPLTHSLTHALLVPLRRSCASLSRLERQRKVFRALALAHYAKVKRRGRCRVVAFWNETGSDDARARRNLIRAARIPDPSRSRVCRVRAIYEKRGTGCGCCAIIVLCVCV